MTRAYLLGVSVSLALLLGACAEKPAKKPADKTFTEAEQLARAKVLVSGASKNVAQAERVFPALGGMVGVVIGSPDGQGRKGIVWMSPDGSAIFPGAPTDEKGENISERIAIEQKMNASADAAPAASDPDSNAATLLGQAAQSNSQAILQGTAGPLVTVFMDLNCSHCHTFFVNAQPQVKAGKLRVRYVLAGFLTPSSAPKAAAILKASDPLAALVKAEADYAKNGQNGKAPVADKAALAIVEANTKLLAITGNISTPLVLYCSTNKTVHAVSGAPTDMAGFLKGVSSEGHPACAK